MIHSDVCGPTFVSSMGGSRYYVTFIDDYACHTSVYFMKTKDEVLEKFKKFCNFAEKFTWKQVKVPFPEAVNIAVYQRNQSSTTAMKKKITPYEWLFKRKLDVANLKVLGCISFVHVPDNQRKKLEARSRKAMLVRYPDSVKGCKFYDPV